MSALPCPFLELAEEVPVAAGTAKCAKAYGSSDTAEGGKDVFAQRGDAVADCLEASPRTCGFSRRAGNRLQRPVD
jgi:hypothetical protein